MKEINSTLKIIATALWFLFAVEYGSCILKGSHSNPVIVQEKKY